MSLTLPSRGRCGWCREYYAVSFLVPNKVWDLVVSPNHREAPSCLTCFARMGDERGVLWDEDIKFFPTSLERHRREVVVPTLGRRECDPAHCTPTGGICCACDHAGAGEARCNWREDGEHCSHWKKGPDLDVQPEPFATLIREDWGSRN